MILFNEGFCLALATDNRRRQAPFLDLGSPGPHVDSFVPIIYDDGPYEMLILLDDGAFATTWRRFLKIQNNRAPPGS